DSSLVNFGVFEFASNTTTSSGTNEKLVFYSVGYNDKSFYTVGSSTHYIRLQANYSIANVVGKTTVSRLNSPLEAVIERFSPCFVTPSMFANQTNNTDAKMIQAAVNYAFAHRCDVAFDRMYTLNSGEYILLNKYNGISADRYITRFFGIGGAKNNPTTNEILGAGITKKNSGNCFVTNSSYKYSADFIFENLTFVSEEGAGCNVFDLTTLMYLTVTGCFFKNVDSVARNAGSSDTRTKYWQAITFKDSTIVGGKGYAFVGTGCYFTKFSNLVIEHRDGGIKFDASLSPSDYYFKCRNLIIENCCIEGLHGKFLTTMSDDTPTNGAAISIDNPVSVTISGCYFESNYKNILVKNNTANAVYSCYIKDCWLSGYFYKERYGTSASYKEIVDDKYIVTISGDAGHYQIEKCATERGGIVNAPMNQAGITILYLGNVLDATAKGEMDYGSFTYDSDTGTWTGSSPTNNTSVVTGGNNNESACKTYQVVSMT
ncbi:MAG: hypothetical protein II630_09925, partial [Bacteroidales bacterium]|nr:hypothetical protein [Bacteroidales bacterium]